MGAPLGTGSLAGAPSTRVADVDVGVERMCAAGATVVFPIVEFCGERMARLRDPYGHLWLLTRRIEELSPEELQQRRDAWASPAQPSKTYAATNWQRKHKEERSCRRRER